MYRHTWFIVLMLYCSFLQIVTCVANLCCQLITFFAVKYFYEGMYMVFLDVYYCTLIRLQYSINIAFMCIWKPKIPCDFLYNDNLIVVVWSQSL